MKTITITRFMRVAPALFLTFPRAEALEAHLQVVQTGSNFTYTVFNNEVGGSPLFLNALHMQVRAPFEVVSSPLGWTFETDGFTFIDWVCTNGIPPYPQDIAPGGSLNGFALQSKVASTETNSFALTTWDHGGDTSGPVYLGKILAPAILSFDASLTNVSYSRSNTFQFNVKGIPSFSYAIQASSNLTSWTYALTNSAPFSFVDTNRAVMRFYRPIFVPDSNSWPVLAD